MSHCSHNFKRLWLIQQQKRNETDAFKFSSKDTEKEWAKLCEWSSLEKKGSNFQHLEMVHIFAVANMLQRPIMVMGSKIVKIANIESKNRMRGIYLPLCEDAQTCQKSPILLVYHAGHFSTLKYDSNWILLHDELGGQLPVQFMEAKYASKCLMNYMEVEYELV